MNTPAVLVGQAVGDALGMPFEKPTDEVHPGLAAWDGSYQPGTWHKLPTGHWTDDTEMAMALAGSLEDCGGNYYPSDVAESYKLWFQGTPHGAGSTTKKAMANLINGASFSESGVVFHDDDGAKVGNGPAMRIAPLGLCFPPSQALDFYCIVDADITHRHREAYAGSRAVARAVSLLIEGRDDIYDIVPKVVDDKPSMTKDAIILAAQLVHKGVPHEEAMLQLGRRGNMAQTVGSAFYFACWYYNDFEGAVTGAVRAGGDTDTRACIVGALVGAGFGLENIPKKYLDGLHELDSLKETDDNLMRLRVKG